MQLNEYKENPRAFHARMIQQLYVVDVRRASLKPLWDVPIDIAADRPKVFWSPSSSLVLVTPTLVPLDDKSSKDFSGATAAVVDVRTGGWAPVSAALPLGIDSSSVTWRSDSELLLSTGSDRVRRFHRRAEGWIESNALEIEQHAPGAKRSTITVAIKENPNAPPALYSIDNSGNAETLLLDFNRSLRTQYLLGRVEIVSWSDKSGRAWKGRLFYPVGYRSGDRYPLVIQTHGLGGLGDFTLYGQGNPQPTLGPGWSVYLAQPLANNGVAVLQVAEPEEPREYTTALDEVRGYTESYEAAVHYLDDRGLVDLARVGIMGHSRTGWHVDYALTHSEFVYAAAIVDDNMDAGYIQDALSGWTNGEVPNGAEPFGVGLVSWLENSPAFNVERVRTPLLQQVTDPLAGVVTPVEAGWELYSRLRHLNLPVAFYVAPEFMRGSHNLQNPRQVISVQRRALEWWLYWLKDERCTDAKSAEQYRYWDELRRERDAALQIPRPPVLQLAVKPVG
jgi:dienelactone hydrolase